MKAARLEERAFRDFLNPAVVVVTIVVVVVVDKKPQDWAQKVRPTGLDPKFEQTRKFRGACWENVY